MIQAKKVKLPTMVVSGFLLGHINAQRAIPFFNKFLDMDWEVMKAEG